MTDQPAATLVDLMADGIRAALERLGDADLDAHELARAALEAGRPPERPIVFPTPAGEVALLRIPAGLADVPQCDACGSEPAGVAMRVRLSRFDTGEDLMHVGGRCFAAGLAIAFGREHVRAGGDVTDLAVDDPPGA